MAKDGENETTKAERKDVDSVVETKASLPVEGERPPPTYKVMAITMSRLWLVHLFVQDNHCSVHLHTFKYVPQNNSY